MKNIYFVGPLLKLAFGFWKKDAKECQLLTPDRYEEDDIEKSVDTI